MGVLQLLQRLKAQVNPFDNGQTGWGQPAHRAPVQQLPLDRIPQLSSAVRLPKGRKPVAINGVPGGFSMNGVPFYNPARTNVVGGPASYQAMPLYLSSEFQPLPLAQKVQRRGP